MRYTYRGPFHLVCGFSIYFLNSVYQNSKAVNLNFDVSIFLMVCVVSCLNNHEQFPYFHLQASSFICKRSEVNSFE